MAEHGFRAIGVGISWAALRMACRVHANVTCVAVELRYGVPSGAMSCRLIVAAT